VVLAQTQKYIQTDFKINLKLALNKKKKEMYLFPSLLGSAQNYFPPAASFLSPPSLLSTLAAQELAQPTAKPAQPLSASALLSSFLLTSGSP